MKPWMMRPNPGPICCLRRMIEQNCIHHGVRPMMLHAMNRELPLRLV